MSRRHGFVRAESYTGRLGLQTEVAVDTEDGVAHDSAIRCDFLTLMFKERLRHLVSKLSPAKLAELDLALAVALDLPMTAVPRRRRSH